MTSAIICKRDSTLHGGIVLEGFTTFNEQDATYLKHTKAKEYK